MSSFFWSFETTLSDINKKQSFVQKDTGLPTRFSEKVYLTATDIECDMADIPTGMAKYALFYDVDIEQLSSPAIIAINAKISAMRSGEKVHDQAQIRALVHERRAEQLAQCVRLRAEGKIGVKALVGAYLHETLYSQYDDDYIDEDDDIDE